MPTIKWPAWAALAAALVCAGCSSSSGPSLPDLKLPTLEGRSAAPLSSCATAKCLTIYVAPWCGYCRQATPLILETRRYLDARGVETRVIVGLDHPEPVQNYARLFGPATLLDINGSFSVSGVPHFYVSDASGKILKELGGLPMGADNAEGMARFLELAN